MSAEAEPAADALPPDVVASIVRGVGSYMRSTPPQELPRSLRPLRGFRQQALMRRRGEVLSALDDDALRGAILQWLDGRTPLTGGDAENLRLACERSDGWQRRLARRSPRVVRPPASREADDVRARLDAERERSRRYRDELRAQRDHARRSVEAERARAAELSRRLDDALAELDQERKAARDATARSEAATADVERRIRREQRATAKAKEEADEARREMRSAKRDLARARREIERLQRRVDEAAPSPRPVIRRRPPAPGPRPRRRRPLRVPRGRLPEDPQTLDEWLSDVDVHLLIDGYNVTKAERGFAGVTLEQQRERLIDEVTKLAVRKQVRTTIVFDGSSVPPGTSRPRRRTISVEYSRPNEPADDHLIAKLDAAPAEPAVLVTNDRDLRARAAERGATLATSDQLLALIR